MQGWSFLLEAVPPLRRAVPEPSRAVGASGPTDL